MTERTLSAVVMAAGVGSRMRSATPKHLHPLLGRRLVDWVLEAARPLSPDPLVVVTSPAAADAYDDDVTVAVQERPLGTGDAVRRAQDHASTAQDVLVLSGDTPLLTTELLEQLLAAHRSAEATATVLSFEPGDMLSYGRIVRGPNGELERIVEAADASTDELELREANSSIYVFDAVALWPAVARLEPKNAQGELYLTDVVRDLVGAGARVAVHVADDPANASGVNTRAELAEAGRVLRDRLNRTHMLAGVTIVDPSTTWIDPTVELAPDTTVHPFTILRGMTRVATGAAIGPHAVVSDATVGEGVAVGPFCYIRPGTVLEAGAKAGVFVEIKNSRIGARTKVPHLSYVGDADIGEDTNIGAGTITANFPHEPGQPKGRTTIGSNVRTGVDNAFVAPVEIGDHAWIAAGSVITEDVPANALAVARSRQVNKEGRGGDRND